MNNQQEDETKTTDTTDSRAVNHHYKKINGLNWLEPDSEFTWFYDVKVNAETGDICADDWVQSVLGSNLEDYVPMDIKGLFETAQGALLYGCFFYPACTLAIEQLFRIAETAVSSKCELLMAPKSLNTFAKRIKWLQENHNLEENWNFWQHARTLRNSTSHPAFQMIISPCMAVNMLKRITEKINALFAVK